MEVIVNRPVKYLIIFVLAICVILIVATAALQFVNLDPFRDRIESMATKAIGRRVDINSHLDINLFPHPEVILNDVTFANAKWGSEPAMVRVGHVDAAISFLSLFSDTIIVRRVRLNDASLLLERNAQQVGNWVMETTASPAGTEEETDQDPDGAAGIPLIVHSAELNNIAVTLRTTERPDQVYRLKAFSLQTDDSGNLILKSSGKLLDLPVALNGKITSQETFADFGAVKVALEASFPEGKFTGQLSTSRLATFGDLQGTVKITVGDIGKVLEKAKIKAPFTGPLTAEAKVNRDGSVYTATAEIREEGMTTTVDASYKDKLLEFSAALTPPKRAGELFGLQGLSDDPLKLKAKVTGSDVSKFTINQFEANVGDNQLAGRGRVNMNGSSEVSLTLTSPDLSTFLDKLPESDMNAKAKVQYSAEKISVPEFGVSFKVQDIGKALEKTKIKAPFTGPLTAEAKVHMDGSVYKATAGIRVEGMTTTVDASYKDKLLEFSAALTPPKRAGELFGLQGLSDDPLKLKAKVTGSDVSKFTIKQFEANVGENKLAGKGRVDMNGGSEISLSLTSPNLSTVFNKLPEMDMNAKARVQYSAGNITMPEFDMSFDKSDINGDITIIRGDKHNITANITSNQLDLRPLGKILTAESAEKKTEPENRYVFKNTSLPLEALEGLESDITLSVSHFYYDAFEIKDAVIDAAVHNGHVDAKVKFNSVNEGYAAAKIDLETQGKKATVDALVSLSDFRIKALLAKGISPEEVPPLSVSLEIKAAGSSPRELVSAANGRVLITQGSGKINNAMMGRFSSDIIGQLISALNPFTKDEEFSNWDCTVLSVDIIDGRAVFDTILSQDEKVMIVGGGDIDLKTEKLNIEFNTKPRTGVGISADMFVTPFIKVIGTLASPAIGLNQKGTLLTGGAAIATGGLSILAKGLFDRATAQGDHCEKALENVGNHIHYSF